MQRYSVHLSQWRHSSNRSATCLSPRQARFAARELFYFFVDAVVGRSAAPLDHFPSLLVRWDDDAYRTHSIRENLGDLFLALDHQMPARPAHDDVLRPWLHPLGRSGHGGSGTEATDLDSPR